MIDQPDQILGAGNAHGHVELAGCQLAHAGQQAGAAGEHHTRGQQAVVTRAADLLVQEFEDLFDAGFDDVQPGRVRFTC